MLRIQSTSPHGGSVADQVAIALAAVQGGERACIVAGSEWTARMVATRLRGHGVLVNQAGCYLEIDPMDMLH